MLLGIALVVEELHKGQRLVFRYPEALPSTLLNLQTSSPQLFQALLKLYHDYQSLSPDNFARLFKRKKNASSSQLLEVAIDDLKYISHPIACGETGSDRITQFNIIATVVRSSAIARLLSRCTDLQQSSIRNPLTTSLGFNQLPLFTVDHNVLAQVVELFSHALYHEERKNGYVSRQVKVMTSDEPRVPPDYDLSPPNKPPGTEPLPFTPTASTRERAASTLPIATSTTSSISRDRSESTAPSHLAISFDGVTPTSSAHGSAPKLEAAVPETQPGSGSTSLTSFSECLAMMEHRLQTSSLANELRHFYHALLEARELTLTINANEGGLQIYHSLLPPPPSEPLPPPQPSPYPSQSILAFRFKYQTFFSTFPFQSILPLFSSILSREDYPRHYHLLSAVDPRLTIEEIAAGLEENLETVLTLTTELYNYKLIDIIDPILLNSIYYINPDCDTSISSVVNKAFFHHFSHFLSIRPIDFMSILNMFNGKNSLEAVMSQVSNALGEYIVDITIWLLQWRVLKEFRQYIVRMGSGVGGETGVHSDRIGHQVMQVMEDNKVHVMALREVSWRTGLSMDEIQTNISSRRAGNLSLTAF